MGADSPAHAVMLGNSKVTKLGDDFLIESDVVNIKKRKAIHNVHRNS